MDKIDALLKAVDEADEIPDEVVGAVNDLADEMEDATKGGLGWRAFFYKGGSFSKTATFATVANVLVLFSFIMGFFMGMEIDLFGHMWTVPEFNDKAAWSILAIVNGTYIGNNMVKAKSHG
jgi:hypothetical protein